MEDEVEAENLLTMIADINQYCGRSFFDLGEEEDEINALMADITKAVTDNTEEGTAEREALQSAEQAFTWYSCFSWA